MQYNVFLYAYKTTEYTENSDELVVSIYNISISYLILYNHLCIIEISYTTKNSIKRGWKKTWGFATSYPARQGTLPLPYHSQQPVAKMRPAGHLSFDQL